MALDGIGERVDEMSVADHLERRHCLERVGGITYLTGLSTEAAISGAVPELASVVKRAFLDREVSLALSTTLERIKNGVPAEDLIAGLSTELDVIQRSNRRDRRTTSEGIQDHLHHVLTEPESERLSSLKLPWRLGQFVPGGLPIDKVTVIFGASGALKTTITNAMIRHFAQQLEPGELAIKYGLEDNALLEYQRLISVLSGISLADVIERKFDAAELKTLKKFQAEWLERLVIYDDVPMIPEELIRIYRSETDKVRFVTYDYLQMMDWHTGGERETLHKSMLLFQRAASRDKVAQIVVSQIDEKKVVPYDMKGRPMDTRPRMEHLFGSQTIKNACKLGIAIYRPYKYFPDKPTTKKDEDRYGSHYAELGDKAEPWWESLAEIIIRKNVLGPVDRECPVLVRLDRGTVSAF